MPHDFFDERGTALPPPPGMMQAFGGFPGFDFTPFHQQGPPFMMTTATATSAITDNNNNNRGQSKSNDNDQNLANNNDMMPFNIGGSLLVDGQQQQDRQPTFPGMKSKNEFEFKEGINNIANNSESVLSLSQMNDGSIKQVNGKIADKTSDFKNLQGINSSFLQKERHHVPSLSIDSNKDGQTLLNMLKQSSPSGANATFLNEESSKSNIQGIFFDQNAVEIATNENKSE